MFTGAVAAAPAGPGAEIPGHYGRQTVGGRFVQVDSLGQGHVQVDFLRVAGRGGGPARLPEGRLLAVDAEGGPEEIRQHLRGQLVGTDAAIRPRSCKAARTDLPPSLCGFGRLIGCKSWAELVAGALSWAKVDAAGVSTAKAGTVFKNVLRFI